MTTEFKRLGKRGSYRLGKLRAQGIRAAGPPPPFRPSFARCHRRGPVSAWLLVLLGGTLVIWWGAALGWWFLPFAAGLAAGLANRIAGWQLRFAVPAVVLMAAAGWGIALWWQVVGGHQADGAVARVIAALGGLPAYAVTGVLVTILVAAVQAVTGYWLGRALTPRPAGELWRPWRLVSPGAGEYRVTTCARRGGTVPPRCSGEAAPLALPNGLAGSRSPPGAAACRRWRPCCRRTDRLLR